MRWRMQQETSDTSQNQQRPPLLQGAGDGGAPGTIRTSDPQIRSLMLYPAELRVRVGARHIRGSIVLGKACLGRFSDFGTVRGPIEYRAAVWRVLRFPQG
jgi:hypothetical protein